MCPEADDVLFKLPIFTCLVAGNACQEALWQVELPEMGGGDGAGNFVHEGSVNQSITGGTFLLSPESAKLQRSCATVRLILMHLFCSGVAVWCFCWHFSYTHLVRMF